MACARGMSLLGGAVLLSSSLAISGHRLAEVTVAGNESVTVVAKHGAQQDALIPHDGELQLAQVRTALDPPMPAREALERLKQGNARYVNRQPVRSANAGMRAALTEQGQNPMALVLGCADSRCPVETIVDAQPGEVFVLRNAGNACPSGEGSIVGSAEFAVGALGTRLVVVMGHTKCGAIKGASQLVVGAGVGPGQQKAEPKQLSALDKYLCSLTAPAEEVAKKLGSEASMEEVAAAAVYTNVFHTIRSLLKHSALLRNSARTGGVELHGAVYDIKTGKVEFLGQHPDLEGLLSAGA